MKIKAILFLAIILTGLITVSEYSYSQFGKNKVQYQNFDWKYIQSKHFDVYYNAGTKYLASFTAVECENSLVSIQQTLNYKITNRIKVIVYESHNEFQQTNVISQFMPEGVGGVTELFKNRVVVPFQGTYAQLEHVIHHELVHAVLNDMFYGGTFQSAVSSSNMVQIPLWMNEGFAEWESIGGMDTHTDMFMRDLTISEQLPPLERIYGYLAYRAGQTFYWYVAENYGKERVGDLVNRLRVNPTLDATFKSAFNLSLEEFSEKWQKYLKKYYWTDLDIFEDPKDFASALTDHKKKGNFYNSSPAISPNGDKMAYISDRNGLFAVFIQDIDDKDEVRELVSSFRAQDFEDLNMLTPGISWDPTGKKIAISAKSGGEDAIFIVDAEDGDYDKLKFGIRSINSVTWSPDGNSLAFVGTKDQKSDLFIYRFNTERLSNLTNDVFGDLNPVWAPGSDMLYFISDRDNNVSGDFQKNDYKMWHHNTGLSDIYSIDVLSKEITRITYDPDFEKTSVSVNKSANKLLYVSDKNGIGNIYEYDLIKEESRPLTNSINGITQLSLANDDSKLLFTVQINGGYDLFMIRYPFDRKLDIDVLPLTKLRKTEQEHQEMVEELLFDDESDESENGGEVLTGYGNTDIEFGRQQIIKPNPEAQKKLEDIDSEPVTGEDIDDSSFVERDYKITFSPDLVLGNPGYSTYWGFQGVTQMLFSDVMGDHQIYLVANLLLDLRNSSFYFAYNYLPEIIDYQLSAFHAAGFVYKWENDNILEYPDRKLYRYRRWGTAINASYPFDLFNRIEWGLTWMNISREDIDDPNSTRNVSKMLFVPEGRYVHDDALWGLFAPMKGTRYSFGFKGTPKLSDNGVGFMSLTTDIRHYIYLWDYMSIAIRGTGGASFGPDPQNFFLGGTESWMNPTFINNTLPFDEPEDFAFMEFKMPMRGFSVAEKQGSKFFLTNLELRFPLFRALIAGPVPILFQSVMGALFLDVGGAWNNNFKATVKDEDGKRYPADLLMSSGVGVRSIIFGIPLKLDIAWRYEWHNWSRPQYLISLGYDF